MSTKIQLALARLDPANDAHWTSDGSPRLDAIEELAGEKFTRRQVIDAAPQLTRESAAAAAPGQTEQPQAPAIDQFQTGLHAPQEPAQDPEFAQPEPEAKDPVLDNLYAERQSISNQIHRLRKTREDLNREIGELEQAHDKVSKEITAAEPLGSNQAGIQEYLRRQNEIRMARYQRRAAILRDLDAKDFVGKSPLDAAMARKNSRGTQRPKLPPVG
ncbi:MAG TPA: hypothetical protein PKN52_04445 [Trueperaceae bacterium]|nr:hypothetical protein [Trueperaceae bacterium]